MRISLNGFENIFSPKSLNVREPSELIEELTMEEDAQDNTATDLAHGDIKDHLKTLNKNLGLSDIPENNTSGSARDIVCNINRNMLAALHSKAFPEDGYQSKEIGLLDYLQALINASNRKDYSRRIYSNDATDSNPISLLKSLLEGLLKFLRPVNGLIFNEIYKGNIGDIYEPAFP